MEKKPESFKDSVVFFLQKYKKLINDIIFWGLIFFILYYTDWIGVFYWIINFPSEMMNILYPIYGLLVVFLMKFIIDIFTYPRNLFILSIGVIKRFVIEDFIIPLFIKNYWNVVRVEKIIYYRLRYREFKKLPVLILGPFLGGLTLFFGYFTSLTTLWIFIEKVFANKIFSYIKIMFLQWIPAIWIFLIDLPLITLILEYTFLSKIVDFFKGIEIPYITQPIKKFLKAIDEKIQATQKFFDNNIGKLLRNRAIKNKYKTREKITKILEKHSHDYHVKGESYDYDAFKLKLDRLERWRDIRKTRKKDAKKLKRRILKYKVKKVPTKLKQKVGDLKTNFKLERKKENGN